MRAGDAEESDDWTVLSSMGSDEGRANSDIPEYNPSPLSNPHPYPGEDDEAAGSAGLRVRRPHTTM